MREENGKTTDEARAEVEKAIELTEFACSLPQLMAGELLEVSAGVECRVDRKPLGVVASIAPFNFPNMVPHWTIPNAIALGNCMILKPSEQVPLSAGRIAELLKEAGLPDGVLNIVHGDKEIVEAICDHPDIKAVSLRGLHQNCQSRLPARHGQPQALRGLGRGQKPPAGAARCPRGYDGLQRGRVHVGLRGAALHGGLGHGGRGRRGAHYCPTGRRSPQDRAGQKPGLRHQPRRPRSASSATSPKPKQAGAKILLDGRNAVVPGQEEGYYVGPTVIDHVTPDMAIAHEEVFGPVLAIIRANDSG